MSFHPSIHTHGKSTALLQILLPTLILLQHTVTQIQTHSPRLCLTHTLNLCGVSNSICLSALSLILFSSSLSRSLFLHSSSHTEPLLPYSSSSSHPSPPFLSLSCPTTCNLRLLFSRLFTFLYHFLLLQFDFSILFVTCPFSSSTSSVALIIFFFVPVTSLSHFSSSYPCCFFSPLSSFLHYLPTTRGRWIQKAVKEASEWNRKSDRVAKRLKHTDNQPTCQWRLL